MKLVNQSLVFELLIISGFGLVFSLVFRNIQSSMAYVIIYNGENLKIYKHIFKIRDGKKCRQAAKLF